MRNSSTRSALPWILGAIMLLVLGSCVVLFAAGEDLFGSDPGTIDSYNRDTLDSCRLPPDSTLVQVSVRPVIDETGQRYRSMWYVYASPLPADDVADFFGVEAERSMLVAPERSCRSRQRPSVLVQPESVAGEPTAGTTQGPSDPLPTYHGLWADHAAEVTMSEPVPAETHSFFRLRLAQREVDGLL